jgi:putative ABC transport system substrate-binding protein
MRARTVAAIVVLSLALVGIAGRFPLAHAQSPARVGVLAPTADGVLLGALRDGLRDLGYVEGRTIAFEYRSANGRTDQLPGLAAELVRLRVNVIVTTSPPGVRAAKQATSTIPIVFAAVDDAVEEGFVASLARPGANLTGASWLNTELSAKRLELLKETLPGVSRVAFLREAVGGAGAVRASMSAARLLGLQLQVLELRDPSELDSAFAVMAREHVGALAVHHGPMIVTHLRRIVDLAQRIRIPAIFPDGRFVEVGGLMSYGPSLPSMYRRAAVYVDKILKGARPRDLPVEQPSRFELRINLKGAKALGLTIPPAVLARADQVIN